VMPLKKASGPTVLIIEPRKKPKAKAPKKNKAGKKKTKVARRAK